MRVCVLPGGAQWQDATRKNYYAKYSTRMLLCLHLLLNVAVFPIVWSNEGRLASIRSELVPPPVTDLDPRIGPGTRFYIQQVENMMVRRATAGSSNTRTGPTAAR